MGPVNGLQVAIARKGGKNGQIETIYNNSTFYDDCTNSRALIGQFSLSITRKTYEFIIYAMRQRARVDNLTVCYHKKQIDVSFSRVCPVIDHEVRHDIVKVVCRSTRLYIAS